jgi:aminodeoxychorismate lyase
VDTIISYNGNLVPERKVFVSVNNRSFRYGDGCFETIKVINGKIVLGDLHFARLLSSLQKLQFAIPEFLNLQYLQDQILKVAEKNKHSSLARVRITAYRADGALYDAVSNVPNIIIQSLAANQQSNSFNKEGFNLDFFRDAKKTCDHFSNIKSNSYLPSVMGALHAQQNKLNDCILLNCYNRVCEATIANVFIIKDGTIKTPVLTEGCVDGVMRKHLISCIKKADFPFKEGEILADEITEASEVFLTNALYGIRWVKKVGNTNFTNQLSAVLHEKFIIPLFNSSTF